MKVYKNIRYSYYDRRDGSGPFYATFDQWSPYQSSYKSIEDVIQKSHPDYCRIVVMDYDTVEM